MPEELECAAIRRRIAREFERLPLGAQGRYKAALRELFAEAEVAGPSPAETPAEAALRLHRAALARSRLRYYAEGVSEGRRERVSRRA